MKFLVVSCLLASAAWGSATHAATPPPVGLAHIPQSAACDVDALNVWLRAAAAFVEADVALSTAGKGKAEVGGAKVVTPSETKKSGGLKVRVGPSAYGGLGIFPAAPVATLEPVLRIPMAVSISLDAVATPSGPLRRSLPGAAYSPATATTNVDVDPAADVAFVAYRRPYGAALAAAKEANRLYSSTVLAMALMAEDALMALQTEAVAPYVRGELRRAGGGSSGEKEIDNISSSNNKESDDDYFDAHSSTSGSPLPVSLTPLAPWLACLPSTSDLPHMELWRLKVDSAARAIAAGRAGEVKKKGTKEEKKEKQRVRQARREIAANVSAAWAASITGAMLNYAEPRNHQLTSLLTSSSSSSSSPSTPSNVLRAMAASEDFRHIAHTVDDNAREFKRAAESSVAVTSLVFANSAASPTNDHSTNVAAFPLMKSKRKQRLVDAVKDSLVAYAVCVADSTARRAIPLAAAITADGRREKIPDGKVKREEQKEEEEVLATEDDSMYFDDDTSDAVAKALAKVDEKQQPRKEEEKEGAPDAANDPLLLLALATPAELMQLAKGVIDDCGAGAVGERVTDSIAIPRITAVIVGANADEKEKEKDDGIEMRRQRLAALDRKARRVVNGLFSSEHYARAAALHSSRAWNVRGQQYLVPVSDFFNYGALPLAATDDKQEKRRIIRRRGGGSTFVGNSAVMRRQRFGDRSSDFLAHHRIHQSDAAAPLVAHFDGDPSSPEGIRAAADQHAARGRRPMRRKQFGESFFTSATAMLARALAPPATIDKESSKVHVAVNATTAAAVVPLLSYLVAAKSEDDSGEGPAESLVDPKRPPTASEQFFEVLSDRSSSSSSSFAFEAKGSSAKKGREEGREPSSHNDGELLESYGDSPNYIYFTYHGFTPDVNPTECVRPFSSYRPHVIDPLAVTAAAAAQKGKEGGTAPDNDADGGKRSLLLPRPPQAASAAYRAGMAITNAIGTAARSGNGGACLYNTTAYQYAFVAAAGGEGKGKSGKGEGGGNVPYLPIARSLASPALVSNGELCPMLLTWSVGATLFHGARAVEFAVPQADDVDANEKKNSRAFGNEIAFVFATEEEEEKKRGGNSVTFASRYFEAMAECILSAPLGDKGSNIVKGGSAPSTAALEGALRGAAISHGGLWEWYSSWLSGACGGISSAGSAASLPTRSSSVDEGNAIVQTARGLGRRLIARHLVASVGGNDAVASEEALLSVVANYRITPLLSEWMRSEFSRQQAAHYRSLLLHYFKEQHGTSDTNGDAAALAARRRLIRRAEMNMSAAVGLGRKDDALPRDTALTEEELSEIAALAPIPAALRAPSSSSSSSSLEMLPLQTLLLQTEASLIAFRAPKKAIYKAHLALLRAKLRTLGRQQTALEGRIEAAITVAAQEILASVKRNRDTAASNSDKASANDNQRIVDVDDEL